MLKLTLTKLTNTLTQQTKLTVKNNHIAGVKNWAHLYHYEQRIFLKLRDFWDLVIQSLLEHLRSEKRRKKYVIFIIKRMSLLPRGFSM